MAIKHLPQQGVISPHRRTTKAILARQLIRLLISEDTIQIRGILQPIPMILTAKMVTITQALHLPLATRRMDLMGAWHMDLLDKGSHRPLLVKERALPVDTAASARFVDSPWVS
jgi:hypothetical protein